MAWRYLFGIFILVLGAGFLAEQMQPIAVSTPPWRFLVILSQWWPLFAIAVGLNQVFRRMDRPLGSLVLVGVSLGVLFWTLDKLPQGFSASLALALTIVALMLGLRMMLPRRTRKLETHTTMSRGAKSVRFVHALKEFQVFGGVHFHNESQQFEGGTVSTIFGEYEIDLRGAALSRHGADLKLNAVFGNITLRVPEEMTVQISGVPVLGTLDNNARQIVPVEAGRPVLRLHCVSLVSAIEITN